MIKSSTRLNLNSDDFYSFNDSTAIPSSIFVKSRLAQLTWMSLNYIRSNSYFLPPSFLNPPEVTNFTIPQDSILWNCTSKNSTPSRFVSDLFWAHLDWVHIQSLILRDNISMMDIGCGTGIYLQKFIQYGLPLSSYVGFDAVKRDLWFDLQTKYTFSKFIESSTSNIKTLIEEYNPNLFVSQSCLEHIDNDIEIIHQICQFALENNKRVLQIHLVPSEHALWLYGLHGIRIYSRTSLQRLLNPIKGPNTRFKIYGLGGRNIFNVHQEFVGNYGLLGTKQHDIRDHDPARYWNSLSAAIKSDLSTSVSCLPSFYAIKIFHNC